MTPFFRALTVFCALAQGGCAAVSAVGSVASLGTQAVTTAGSVALTGVGAAAKAGTTLLPTGSGEAAPTP